MTASTRRRPIEGVARQEQFVGLIPAVVGGFVRSGRRAVVQHRKVRAVRVDGEDGAKPPAAAQARRAIQGVARGRQDQPGQGKYAVGIEARNLVRQPIADARSRRGELMQDRIGRPVGVHGEHGAHAVAAAILRRAVEGVAGGRQHQAALWRRSVPGGRRKVKTMQDREAGTVGVHGIDRASGGVNRIIASGATSGGSAI